MHTRASCGRKSSRVANCTGCVATTGKRELARERDGGGDERVVVGTARALHFEVVAMREPRRPRARRALGAPSALPCSNARADVAVAAAGQRDQAVGAFVEPFAAKLGAPAMLVGAIRARQPVAQPQITAAVGREQDRAKRRVALAVVRDPDVAAGDGLDAGGARGAVELDEPERVGQDR